MELDTSKLSQAGFRKLTPHDNCTVLDLDIEGVGASVYPRLVEIRVPGIDGARQSALWDGSLNLAVDDTVIADEYAGQSVWRISSVGGDSSGAGKVRVSEVWESDFGAVALQTDASGNVILNGTRTLTLPTDIIHASDNDTKMSFTDDQWDLIVGNINMIRADKTTQDVLLLGDVAGTGDVDVNFNKGQMFLRGSDGNLGVATTTPPAPISVMDGGANETSAVFSESLGLYSDSFLNLVASRASGNAFGATWLTLKARGTHASKSNVGNNDELGIFAFYGYQNAAYRSAASIKAIVDASPSGSVVSGRLSFFTTDTGGSANEVMTIKSDGNIGINGVTLPSTEFDIGNGAIEFEEMTAPSAGAANTARLFARDDGAGDTELCVRFNSGLIQVIAPLEFGEVSVIENGTATALTVTTEAQFLFFDTNGPANGATPDHINDHITVGKDGTYLIVVSLSVESAAGSGYQVEFTIQKNNGAAQVGHLHAHRAFSGGGGDFGSVSLSGLAVLSAGDTIELWIENLTSSQDVTIEDATLSIAMIGVNV